MQQRRRYLCTAATAGLFAAVFISSHIVPLVPARADTKSVPTDAVHLKALYSEKCSACHNLPDPVAEPETPIQWQRTVNRMINRYKAGDSISPDEATAIVGYLATFAPRNAGRFTHSPWDTDTIDVWTTQPSHTRVFNFEEGAVPASLAEATGGLSGPAAIWRKVPAPGIPDGTYYKVTPVKPDASRFALLMDTRDSGRSLDIKVRFQMLGGHISPSVGIAFGLTDAKNYDVLRYDGLHGAVTLLKVAEPAHTAVQTTPLAADNKVIAPLAAGWHTLRLLVKDGQIRGWLDGTKRITTSDPSYVSGKVALWSQGDTVAGFDDWTVDFYDDTPVPAS